MSTTRQDNATKEPCNGAHAHHKQRERDNIERERERDKRDKRERERERERGRELVDDNKTKKNQKKLSKRPFLS